MTRFALTILSASLLFGAALAQDSCCPAEKKMSASMQNDAFMAEANRMAMQGDGKDACCKSTATKAVAKGDPGCCNAKAALAKFKVFANGEYQYYGCKDSAAKARHEMVAKGWSVGKVQTVRKPTRIG